MVFVVDLVRFVLEQPTPLESASIESNSPPLLSHTCAYTQEGRKKQTPTMRFALSLALSIAAVAAGSIGLGPGPDIQIDWTINGPNITVTTKCIPNAKEGDIAWCAWGLSATGGMYPANVFWMAIDSAGAPLAVEDRAIAAIAQPPCITKQITETKSKSFDKTSGILTVSFTRAINVTNAESKLGYMAFQDSLQYVIGAIGGKTRPTGKCDMTQNEHYGAFTYISVNFLA